MDENNMNSGHTTQGNTASEDDGSFYSWTWLRENPRRRKSRLGTRHRNTPRTLQDLDLNVASNLIQDANSHSIKQTDLLPALSSLLKPCDELIVPVSPENHVQKKVKNETLSVKSPNGILKKRSSFSCFPEKSNFEIRTSPHCPQSHVRFLNEPALDSIVEPFVSLPVDEIDHPADELDKVSSLLPPIQDINIQNEPQPLPVSRINDEFPSSILHFTNGVKSPSPNFSNELRLSTPLIKEERLPSPPPPPPPKPATKPTVRFVEPIISTRKETQEPVQCPVTNYETPFVEPQPVSQFANKAYQCIKVHDKSYKIIKVLGKGGSSTVYEVLQSETNELFAMKKVKLSNVDESVAIDYLNEVALLQNLQNCDIIVKIHDHEYVCNDGKKVLYLVMEKGQADLSASIREISQQSADACMLTILSYWCQMLRAVNEIHKRNIVHSDLKPQNFLWVGNKLKLIDFGIAAVVQEDKTSVYKDMFSGTLNYICPEAMIWKEEGYRTNFKRDVWALGCILYSLIYGYTPYGKLTKDEKKRAVRSPEEYLKFPEREDVPVCLMTSLRACLRINPDERPSISELIDILYSKNEKY